MKSWKCSLFFGKPARKSWHGRAILKVEQLDERIVPAATTIWKPGMDNLLWSNANNWTAGLPDANKVAVFDANPNTGSPANCTYDGSVPLLNQVVAGLTTANQWAGTLSMTGGISLTVQPLIGDASTGFKWNAGPTGTISQGTLSDLLIIWGGDATYNSWSGGNLGGATLGEVDVNGRATLQVTGNATTLGDNIVIGRDFGGSTLQFHDQVVTVTVTNNPYIGVSDSTTDAAANTLLFDTDLTQPNTASKGLTRSATTSGDSFIDNFATITRSNPGLFHIDLPIKNESGTYQTPTLDIRSPGPTGGLWISGTSLNKTADKSVQQLAGKTILENGSTLRGHGILIAGGDLQTYGTTECKITKEAGLFDALTVTGGTITLSADNTAQYGRLFVFSMNWTGGTYEAYINGGTAVGGPNGTRDLRRYRVPAHKRQRRVDAIPDVVANDLGHQQNGHGDLRSWKPVWPCL
jgi:hypothetical protein